jgi:uncharacterized membrane protein YfcA
MWALIIMALAAIVVGWASQSWKPKTRIAWAIAGFIFVAAFYVAWFHYIGLSDRRFSQEDAAYAILSALLCGGLMTAILAIFSKSPEETKGPKRGEGEPRS